MIENVICPSALGPAHQLALHNDVGNILAISIGQTDVRVSMV